MFYLARTELIQSNIVKSWLLFNTDECGITLESKTLKQISQVETTMIQVKQMNTTVDLTKRIATVVLTVRGDGYSNKTLSKAWKPMVIFRGSHSSNFSKNHNMII